MTVQAMAAVLDSTIEGANHRFVLLAFANRADDDGYCWPGIAHICDQTDLSESTVKRSIRHLADVGLLDRAPRFTPQGDRTSNMYRINLELLATMARPKLPRGVDQSEHARHFASSGGGGVTQTPPRAVGQ